eukprot:gene23230-8811_t
MPLAMLFKSVSYCMSAASSYAVAATFNDEQGERSLKTDLRDVGDTYSKAGSAFFVAVDRDDDDLVLGTISVQCNPPNG